MSRCIQILVLLFMAQVCGGNSIINPVLLIEETKETLCDGIIYTKLKYVNKSPTVLHVVEVDPSKHRFDLCLADNQRDCVSTIAKRHNAFIAVNGANYRRGGPYNGCRLNLLYALNALCFTGSFYAGAMVIDQKGEIGIDFCRARPSIAMHTKTKEIEIVLHGINIPRMANQTVMYDRSFNHRYVCVDDDVFVLKKTESNISCFLGKSQKIEIPSTGFIVVLSADAVSGLDQEVLVDMTFAMNLYVNSHFNDIKLVLCGAGRLLKNGLCCDIYGELSGYEANVHYGDEVAADFGDPGQRAVLIDGCHPRTAIGVKPNGNIILLVADGRSSASAGISLKELQDIFLQLGCSDALNIGGGGCSTLVVNNQLINNPSQGIERPVSEALCVTLRHE